MKKIIFILLILLFSIQIYPENKYFTGEVYKIDKYTKEVICRGEDLTSIKVGQILYICNEKNNLIAKVEVVRYYTTIIDTKLIWGDINSIKVKMPVYSDTSQFTGKKAKVIKYEKDYDYYWWDAKVVYNVEGEEYVKNIKIILPKLIELQAPGYDEPVKIDSEEVKSFELEEGEITGINLKDGSSSELEYIDVDIRNKIPEEKIEKKEKFGKKIISLDISTARRVILIKKGEGCELPPWDKTYGGEDMEWANSIQQTSDGGYIVAGSTYSKGAGDSDVWVLKLDKDGEIIWDKTYGGKDYDEAYSIQQTSDDGYIVAGRTKSKGAGSYDVWVLKLDKNGNIIWEKTYGGEDYDEANSIQQTSDGGYIVAGSTYSKGAGKSDVWVLKLDKNGNIIWDKTYGGEDWDEANSIQQTSDGGYIVAGDTDPEGVNRWLGSFVDVRVLILKLDKNGDIIWDKTYGGEKRDEAISIQQTSDGGYIIAGYTSSKGAGDSDVWVLKLDKNGNIIWDKTYGGKYWDWANSIQQTSDGGYIVAGRTASKGAGSYDFWVLKLDKNGNIK